MPTIDILDQSRTAVLGHRGASAVAKENTSDAFAAARDAGAAGVELDVRRTADDVLVVHHDPEVNGVGVIREMPFEALRAQAPDLLKFEEAMEACAGLLVNIEIKNAPGQPDFDPRDTIAPRVAQWVAATGAYETVIVSSFNPFTIAAVLAADPAIATGWLVPPDFDPVAAVGAAAGAGHRAVNPYHEALRDGAADRVVAAAKEAGLWVITWTPADPSEIASLAKSGVDGVIVDDPAAALAALHTS